MARLRSLPLGRDETHRPPASDTEFVERVHWTNWRTSPLRPPVHHRSGTALRGLQPTLRARLHPGHHQPALRRVDRGLRVRKAHRRAAGPSHPPRAHPGDERRELPPQRQPAERRRAIVSAGSGGCRLASRRYPSRPRRQGGGSRLERGRGRPWQDANRRLAGPTMAPARRHSAQLHAGECFSLGRLFVWCQHPDGAMIDHGAMIARGQLFLVRVESHGGVEGPVAQDATERGDRTTSADPVDCKGAPQTYEVASSAGDASAFHDPPDPVLQS